MNKKLLISIAMLLSLVLANPVFADTKTGSADDITGLKVESSDTVVENASDNKEVKKTTDTTDATKNVVTWCRSHPAIAISACAYLATACWLFSDLPECK